MEGVGGGAIQFGFGCFTRKSIIEDVGFVSDIAVDYISKNFYWTDSQRVKTLSFVLIVFNLTFILFNLHRWTPQRTLLRWLNTGLGGYRRRGGSSCERKWLTRFDDLHRSVNFSRCYMVFGSSWLLNVVFFAVVLCFLLCVFWYFEDGRKIMLLINNVRYCGDISDMFVFVVVLNDRVSLKWLVWTAQPDPRTAQPVPRTAQPDVFYWTRMMSRILVQ